MLSSSAIFIFFAVILFIAGLILWFISRFHKSSNQLDIDKYRRKWLEIERQLVKDDARSCQLAVIEADKLLDTALKESGVQGETMGERLKSAKDVWSNRDSLWQAHKLRNKIVHESDLQVGYAAFRRALAGFKRALKDMGAI